MLGGGIYPGMITATVGTALFIAVVATSLVIVRRRLRYEWWYTVHLMAYAAIALSWFHEIPTGNELVLSRVAADYWRGLYLVTIAVLVIWRVLVPLAERAAVPAARRRGDSSKGQASCRSASPGAASIACGAHAGQFFLWRFLARRVWGTAHPFSLSAAPGGRLASHHRQGRSATILRASLRSRPAPACSPRARSASSPNERRDGRQSGPDRRRHRDHSDSCAGRDDERRSDRAVSRALTDEDVIFRDELDELVRGQRSAVVHYVDRRSRRQRPRPAGSDAPAGARARPRRARRLPLRPARHGGVHPEERPRRARAAAPDPRRALRPHLEASRCAQEH